MKCSNNNAVRVDSLTTENSTRKHKKKGPCIYIKLEMQSATQIHKTKICEYLENYENSCETQKKWIILQ